MKFYKKKRILDLLLRNKLTTIEGSNFDGDIFDLVGNLEKLVTDQTAKNVIGEVMKERINTFVNTRRGSSSTMVDSDIDVRMLQNYVMSNFLPTEYAPTITDVRSSTSHKLQTVTVNFMFLNECFLKIQATFTKRTADTEIDAYIKVGPLSKNGQIPNRLWHKIPDTDYPKAIISMGGITRNFDTESVRLYFTHSGAFSTTSLTWENTNLILTDIVFTEDFRYITDIVFAGHGLSIHLGSDYGNTAETILVDLVMKFGSVEEDNPTYTVISELLRIMQEDEVTG